MPVRTALVFCGVAGSCAAAIGVPVTVHESNRERSIGGEEGAHASDVSWGGSNLTLDNTTRKKICNALGLSGSTHVNEDNSSFSSQNGKYFCQGNNNQKVDMNEELGSQYYQGSVNTGSNKSAIRCLRETQLAEQNSRVNGSMCKKK